MKRVITSSPATTQQPPMKKANVVTSPLKRQNATITAQSVDMEVSTQEDTTLSMDENVYFHWSVRALSADEILNLKAFGWGDYLYPKEENMRLSVGLCKQGANEGRYFLSIGHPNLKRFGFATFLDDQMAEKVEWWGKAKSGTGPTIQSLQLDIQILQNEIQELKSCIYQS